MTYPGSQTIVSAFTDLRDRLAAGDGNAGTNDPLPLDRLIFGSNVQKSNLRPAFVNAAAFSTWQDPRYYSNDPLGKSGTRDPGEGVNGVFMGYNGGPVNCPPATEMRQNITRLPTNGATYEISWVEPKNATSAQKWFPFFHSANEQEHVVNEITATTFTGGRYRKRFKCSYLDAVVRQSWIIWYGEGDLEEIDIREVFLVGNSGRIRDSYASFLGLIPGPLRHLETGNYNNSGQNYEWSNRPRRASFGKTGYAIGGEPIEDLIERSNRSDRDMYICVPTLWTKTLFFDFLRAVFTGVGTDNGMALKPNLRLWIELVGNEPWNPFLFYYAQLAEMGWAAGYGTPGIDQNGARLFMQVKRSLEVLGWIKEGFAAYDDRIIDVVGLAPQNDVFEYRDMKLKGLADANGKPLFKAVAQSIYWGIDAKNQRYGNCTPAEMEPAFNIDYASQTDNFLRNHAEYDADGVIHLLYEVGIDLAGNVYTPEEKETWLNSPQNANLHKREMRRLKSLKVVAILYWDAGAYAEAGAGSWGHWQGENQTSGKADNVLAIQAEVQAELAST